MDYTRLASTAERLIASRGGALTITRSSSGEYDTETGTVDSAEQTVAGHGVRFPYTRSDEGRVKDSDTTWYLTLDNMAFIPAAGDIVTSGGQSWIVTACEPLAPGAVTLMYTVYARRG